MHYINVNLSTRLCSPSPHVCLPPFFTLEFEPPSVVRSVQFSSFTSFHRESCVRDTLLVKRELSDWWSLSEVMLFIPLSYHCRLPRIAFKLVGRRIRAERLHCFGKKAARKRKKKTQVAMLCNMWLLIGDVTVTYYTLGTFQIFFC